MIFLFIIIITYSRIIMLHQRDFHFILAFFPLGSIIPRYTVLSGRGFNGCLTDVQLITDPSTDRREIVHFSQSVLSSTDDVQLYSCHV